MEAGPRRWRTYPPALRSASRQYSRLLARAVGPAPAPMPRTKSTSTRALVAAGTAPALPTSPAPLTPKRLVLVGTGSLSQSIAERSPARSHRVSIDDRSGADPARRGQSGGPPSAVTHALGEPAADLTFAHQRGASIAISSIVGARLKHGAVKRAAAKLISPCRRRPARVHPGVG
jgi:hypothetical protein